MTKKRILLLCLLAVIVATTAATTITSFVRHEVAESNPKALPLRIVLGELPALAYDAGTIERGTRIEVPFVVANPRSSAVTLGPIRTSCDCFRIDLDSNRLEAGHEVAGRAVIDLAEEPMFVGGLSLEAEAQVANKDRSFALKLSVQVR
jgi:hypothetical protein